MLDYKTTLIIAAGVLFFDFSLSLVASCPIYHVATEHGGEQNYCSVFDGLIFGVGLHRLVLFLQTYEHELIAGFTIVLAFSTVFLWLSTRRLWKVTNDTLEHAERTTKSELRAYIGVEPRGVTRLVDQDNLLGHIKIRNFGRIPAKNISIFVLTDYHSDPTKMVFKIGQLYETKTALQPRAEMILSAASVVSIDFIDVTEDGNADYVGCIFVYGKVTYTDEFNTSGWTEFCHRYPCEMMEGDSRISRKHARYHERGGNAAG